MKMTTLRRLEDLSPEAKRALEGMKERGIEIIEHPGIEKYEKCYGSIIASHGHREACLQWLEDKEVI